MGIPWASTPGCHDVASFHPNIFLSTWQDMEDQEDEDTFIEQVICHLILVSTN